MVPDLEAAGDIATGGLLSRAIEPHTGEERDGHTHETHCLNCGCPLKGAYCHCCGQRGHVHRTITAFWHDLVHGVLHLDGKIVQTLPLLAWRPGELTRRYVDGERAKFVSPMALFLFSVFLMFAVFTTVGGPIVTGSVAPSTTAEDRAEALAEFERERRQSLAEIQALRDERARLVAAGEPTRSIDVEIRVAESELRLEERLFGQAMRLLEDEEAREARQAQEQAARESGAATPAAEEQEGEAVIIQGADSLNAWFNDAYRKAKENPSLLIYKIQTNAYKFSWLLIPISVPFVWLLFLHRRRYRAFKGYDHTVFVTYSIAFMSLALIALSLLRPMGLPAAAAVLAMMIIPPIHMYRQLKGAYGLSRFSALWRTFALLNLTIVTATLFGLLLLLMGVLG